MAEFIALPESRVSEVPWWRRLIFALSALVLTLLLVILLKVVRDIFRMPNFEWGNGGEGQVIAYLAVMGGFASLVTYVCFIVPLVLLWPVALQTKGWYWMMSASLLWMPTARTVHPNAHPAEMLQELLHPGGLSLWLEPFALCACGLYLVFLRRSSRRLQSQDLNRGTL